MRILLIGLCLSFLAYCGMRQGNYEPDALKVIVKDSLLFGKWQLCSYGNTSIVQFNVCPEVVLNPFFGTCGQSGDRFRWHTDSGKMDILYDVSMPNRIIETGSYFFKLTKGKDFLKLELIDSSNIHYYLERGF